MPSQPKADCGSMSEYPSEFSGVQHRSVILLLSLSSAHIADSHNYELNKYCFKALKFWGSLLHSSKSLIQSMLWTNQGLPLSCPL